MTFDVLLARLLFASVECCAVALLAALLLRWLKPAPRTAALCWAAVLLKPLVSLAVGSPIAVVRFDAGAVDATPAPIHRSIDTVAIDGSSFAVTSRRRDTTATNFVDPTPSSQPPARELSARAAPAGVKSGDELFGAGRSSSRSATAPVSFASSTPSLAALLVGAWTLGVAVMLARNVRDRLRIGRLLARSREAEPSLHLLARRIAAALQLRSLPGLRVTRELDSPALVGLRRATVLLPEWMVSEREQGMLRWSLRHELAHFRQRDAWLLLLRELAQAAFFFHPVIIWSARRLEVAMELACDRAIAASPLRARAYARQLLAIRERVRDDRALAIGGAFVARTRLVERVRELVGESATFGVGRRGALLLPATLLLLIPLGARRQAAPPSHDPATSPPAAAGRELTAKTGDNVLKGRVVDEAGQPVAKATLRLIQWNGYLHWIDPSLPSPLDVGSAVADEKGGFELRCPRNLCEGPTSQFDLVAAAAGHAPSWHSERPFDELRDRTLVLSTEDVPVEARLVDLEGRPIAGATVRVGFVCSLDGITFDDYVGLLAQHPGLRTGWEFFQWCEAPVGDAPVEVRSDAEGRFKLSGYGRDRCLHLEVRAEGYEIAALEVFTHPGADFSALRPVGRSMMRMQKEFIKQFEERTPRYGPKFTHALAPEQRVTGVVVDAATGEPISDCKVYDQALEEVSEDRTDAEGRFDLKHLPRREEDIRVRIRPPRGESWLSKAVDVPCNASLAPIDLHVELARGIPIRGRVLDPANGGPVRAMLEYYPYVDNPNAATVKTFTWSEESGTDAEGRYSLTALPGPGFVCIHAAADTSEFLAARAEDFHREPGELGYVIAGGAQVGRENMIEARYVDPSADTKEINLDITLRRGNSLVVHVRDRNGKPVHRCKTIARSAALPFEEETSGPDVTIVGLEHGAPRQVLLLDEATESALSLDLTGDESGEREVKLEQCAWLQCHFVDEEGHPLSRWQSGYIMKFANSPYQAGVGGPSFNADAAGRLRVPLAPRFKYSFGVPKPGGKYPDALFDYVEFTLAPGEVKDFGEVRLTVEARGMFQ